jgi:hypothetical protein
MRVGEQRGMAGRLRRCVFPCGRQRTLVSPGRTVRTAAAVAADRNRWSGAKWAVPHGPGRTLTKGPRPRRTFRTLHPLVDRPVLVQLLIHTGARAELRTFSGPSTNTVCRSISLLHAHDLVLNVITFFIFIFSYDFMRFFFFSIRPVYFAPPHSIISIIRL